jgi:predicted transglutaminase-like cysteine proteinase
MQTVIQGVFNQVRENFIYTPDSEQFDRMEDWRIHKKEVEAGEIWRDDCDGFAVTCAEMLAWQDIPFENISLILCEVETGGRHLVCGIEHDGETLILDNRQRILWPHTKIPYKWISTMKASEPGVWREILPPK